LPSRVAFNTLAYLDTSSSSSSFILDKVLSIFFSTGYFISLPRGDLERGALGGGFGSFIWVGIFKGASNCFVLEGNEGVDFTVT